MRVRKPSRLPSAAAAMNVAVQAMMGAAMGLSLALLLVIVNPSGIATLVHDGASPGVFVGTLVLSFGIGAALTGAVFMMTEERGSVR